MFLTSLTKMGYKAEMTMFAWYSSLLEIGSKCTNGIKAAKNWNDNFLVTVINERKRSSHTLFKFALAMACNRKQTKLLHIALTFLILHWRLPWTNPQQNLN